MGAILLWLAMPTTPADGTMFLRGAMAVSVFACSLLVLVYSRGRHPGWAAFMAIGILICLA